MISAIRPCAALLLAIASTFACADDSSSFGAQYVPHGIRPEKGGLANLATVDAGRAGWDWRDLKAGLNRKLDNGWLLALNYTRAIGAASPCDRYGAPGSRMDERPMFASAGRKALVLSMKRSF